MGTPDLAAVVLSHLLEWSGGRVVGVYCQPDRPSGRGMKHNAPPVKVLALEQGLPVFQPLNFNADAEVDTLRELEPDYLLVAAYGLLLPQRLLDIPTKMPLNVHTSLLPKYRGAAPIQRAIMNGESETGVTIMRMEAGLDTGPIILQESVRLAPNEDARGLHDLLAEIGGKTLISALDGLEAGVLTCTPQMHENASYAPKLNKTEGRLDFSRPVREIYAQARGMTPWPGAFGTLVRDGEEDLSVTFLDAKPADVLPEARHMVERRPGDVLPFLVADSLAVLCGDGVYLIRTLRPAGRKVMDAAAFMNGYLKGCGIASFTLPPK